LNPDIIGLSTRSVYKNYVDEVMKQMKKVRSAITVAGGFGATFDPLRYLGHVDYVCIGEGETAMLQMANSIDRKKSPRSANNLVYEDNGKPIFNSLQEPDDNQDFFYNSYMEKVTHYFIENNVVVNPDSYLEYVRDIDPTYADIYFTMCGRGCIYNCSFCCAGEFYIKYSKAGVPLRKRRNRPVENIIMELKHMKKYDFRKSVFYGFILIWRIGLYVRYA